MKRCTRHLLVMATVLLGVLLPADKIAADHVPAAESGTNVYINEVLFAPAAGDFEWVELKNGGTTPARLQHYLITDEDGNSYHIPPTLPSVPAGAFVIVLFDGQGDAANDLDFSDNVAILHAEAGLVDIFDDSADQVALYAGQSTHLPLILAGNPSSKQSIRSNTTRIATQYQSSSSIVSFVAWGADPTPDDDHAVIASIWAKGLFKDLRQIGDETPMPVFPGRSLGLLPGGTNNHSADNWVHYQTTEVTRGTDNPVPGIRDYDPISGATIDSATFAIGWPVVEGATAYHFQMDNDSNLASPEYDLIVDGSAFVPASPIPEGKYYWRVAVVREAQIGAWSMPAEINSLEYPSTTTRIETQSSENVLGIQWQLQRKDTQMICRAGDHETSDVGNNQTMNAPWDAPHPTTGGPKPHGSNYCERASISMLVSYYGGALSQDRIAYEDYQGTANNLGHGLINNTYIDDALTWAGISYDKVWGKPTFAQVKSWIDAGRPLISLRPGHFRVVDGYREFESGGLAVQQIHLLDPWNNARWVDWSSDGTTTVWVGPAWSSGAPGVRSDEDVDDDGIRDTMDDSDGDGLVDFDEYNRFGTDPLNPDTDGDGVADKVDMRGYVFNDTGIWHPRSADWDGDGLAKERDSDNDRRNNDGSPDGCEDINHNGKLDPGETSNFDGTQEGECPYPPEPGLVAWWPADGTANDVIGGNNGRATKRQRLWYGKTRTGIQIRRSG